MHVFKYVLVNLISQLLAAAINTTGISVLVGCSEKQMVNDIEIDWKYTIDEDKTQYYSLPLCINERGMYVLRKCENGRFVGNPPPCFSLQMENYSCLDGLQLGYTPNGDYFCYSVSHSTMTYYESINCPYNQVDAINRTEYIIALSHKFPIWLDYRIEGTRHGFGNYIAKRFLNVNDTFKPWDTNGYVGYDTCLSVENGVLSSDCFCVRYRVCMYRAIPLIRSDELKAMVEEANYCHKSQLPCRLSWFAQNNSTICVCPNSFDKCTTPAVYPLPLGVNNVALGIKVDQDRIMWFENDEVIQNTFWSIPDLKVKTDNDIYIVWNDNGWVFSDQAKQVMCAEYFPAIANTKIILTFDKQKKTPDIGVLNGGAMFTSEGIQAPYDIMCYQNHGFHLRRFFDNDTIWSSGIWQCEGVSLLDTAKKFLSGKVYMEFSDYIYIIRLVENKDFTIKDTLALHIHNMSFPFLSAPIFNIIEYKNIHSDTEIDVL